MNIPVRAWGWEPMPDTVAHANKAVLPGTPVYWPTTHLLVSDGTAAVQRRPAHSLPRKGTPLVASLVQAARPAP